MKTDIIIKQILTDFDKRELDFDIYIVADAQNKTKYESQCKLADSNEAEFFSREEFAQIASAIYSVFGYVKTFYSETQFIKYILEHNISKNECIVFNFSRNGNFQGKKSLIPSFCDLFNLRYTGSNAFVISLLRNKYIFTKAIREEVLCPNTFIFENNFENIYTLLGEKKVIVKNLFDSASIGLNSDCIFNFNITNLNHYLSIYRKFDKNFVIQEFIEGDEYEVLVIQHKKKYYALTPIQIIINNKLGILDSDTSNKYDYVFKIADKNISLMKNMAIKAANILNIKDYARFDFRVKDGQPYLIDIAGTPYTIKHSSIAYMFNQYQFKYDDIFKLIVECTLSNYEN